VESNFTCMVDIIGLHTKLLKCGLLSLNTTITSIIDLALSEIRFTPLRQACSYYLVPKKPNLPADDITNYRRISNLNIISKIT